MNLLNKYLVGTLLVIIFSIVYIYFKQSVELNSFFEVHALKAKLEQVESLGPVLIVVLMASAIVMSPLPSAPIAIASGFAYGHTWGTLYILVGAEIGALIAFSISRMLGYDAVQKRFGNKEKYKYLSSGKHLMFFVFITRLIPFISFDIISYAAGLTKIGYFQFALATFAGILPASFLLAHFGGEMASDDTQKLMTTVLLLGLLTVTPLIIGVIKKNIKKQ